MTDIVAVVDRADRVRAVVDVAHEYAVALGGRLAVYAASRTSGGGPSVDHREAGEAVHVLPDEGSETLRTAAATPADLLVLPALALDAHGWAARLLPACAAPLLAVPDTLAHGGLSRPVRVLAPLDGTREAASAVVVALDLLAGPGADVVVLHVFDEDSAPRFWDQPAHARQSWGEEFLTRHARRPGSRLELRSGSPREEVVDAAHAEHADVIALGCSGDLSPGRARLVRHVLRHTDVPVLLVHPGSRVGRETRTEAAAG